MNNVYAQFVLQPLTYENGSFVSFYPYFQNGTDISLQTDEMTISFAPDYIYLFSYIVQARPNFVGYIQIVPTIGVSEENIYSFAAQNHTASEPLSVSGSFTFYAPVTTYIRLKYNGSASAALLGSFSIVQIAAIR